MKILSVNKASRLWVELNLGLKPEELKAWPLDTNEDVWKLMSELATMASKTEVDRLWAKVNKLKNANIAIEFGHP